MKLVIGVDPGLRGAISAYDALSKKLIGCHDMPLAHFSKRKGRIKPRGQIDHYGLATIVDAYSRYAVLAVIEEVGGMVYLDKFGHIRGQGSAASFNFGKSAGLIQGVIAAHYLPILFTRPAIWKPLMNLTHDKDLSRSEASRLFPYMSSYFYQKRHDGRAESALLALFGANRLLATINFKTLSKAA